MSCGARWQPPSYVFAFCRRCPCGAVGVLKVIEVSSQNYVIRGEPGLVYLSLKHSSIIGGAGGVDVDNCQESVVRGLEGDELRPALY
jgi:hypothetical protein